MLVLSRRVGERVVIPDCELTVTIVSIHGNQVRLGFSAPADVAVLREEVRRPPGPEPAPARESE